MRHLLVTLTVGLAVIALSGCASSVAVPRPYPGSRAGTPSRPPSSTQPLEPTTEATAPAVATSTASSARAADLIETAEALLGTPYRPAGLSPEGFDCSGFVQYVFRQVGLTLPRSVREQSAVGTEVGFEDLLPGDLVFFAIDRRSISHVGIALGPDLFIHAPSERGVVRKERLGAPYWAARFATARRVLPQQ